MFWNDEQLTTTVTVAQIKKSKTKQTKKFKNHEMRIWHHEDDVETWLAGYASTTTTAAAAEVAAVGIGH